MAASFLLAKKVDARVVMDILGHSTIRLTMDTYGHVMAPARRDAAEAMDRALRGHLRGQMGVYQLTTRDG